MKIGTLPTRYGHLTYSGVPDASLYAALAPLDVWWNLPVELGLLSREMHRVASEVKWARMHPRLAPIDPPLFMRQLEYVCEVLRRTGGRVHVSSAGGRGRTGLALACVLVRLHGDTPDEALVIANEVCGGPEEEGQRAFVATLARPGEIRDH